MITEIAQIDVKPGTEKDFEAAVAGEALESQAHEIVERFPVIRRVADLRIEQPRDERAFCVVTDRDVIGVLIRTVEFDPRIEGCLLGRLHEASGSVLQTVDERGQRAGCIGSGTEVFRARGQAGAAPASVLSALK